MRMHLRVLAAVSCSLRMDSQNRQSQIHTPKKKLCHCCHQESRPCVTCETTTSTTFAWATRNTRAPTTRTCLWTSQQHMGRWVTQANPSLIHCVTCVVFYIHLDWLGFSCGSDGYVWARAWANMCTNLKNDLEIVKHWYNFQIWGRCAYQPCDEAHSLGATYWQSELLVRFPELYWSWG